MIETQTDIGTDRDRNNCEKTKRDKEIDKWTPQRHTEHRTE